MTGFELFNVIDKIDDNIIAEPIRKKKNYKFFIVLAAACFSMFVGVKYINQIADYSEYTMEEYQLVELPNGRVACYFLEELTIYEQAKLKSQAGDVIMESDITVYEYKEVDNYSYVIIEKDSSFRLAKFSYYICTNEYQSESDLEEALGSHNYEEYQFGNILSEIYNIYDYSCIESISIYDMSNDRTFIKDVDNIEQIQSFYMIISEMWIVSLVDYSASPELNTDVIMERIQYFEDNSIDAEINSRKIVLTTKDNQELFLIYNVTYGNFFENGSLCYEPLEQENQIWLENFLEINYYD